VVNLLQMEELWAAKDDTFLRKYDLANPKSSTFLKNSAGKLIAS
jgi:hypothetical protein